MSWWVYKCNSRNLEYQSSYGDWEELFKSRDASEWGNVALIPALSKLRKGDMVIAYQTNRNRLVGVAEVARSCDRDGNLYLKPSEIIDGKVREMKRSDSRIDQIPALKQGPIHTVYSIHPRDAAYLLRTARATQKKTGFIAPSVVEPPERVFAEITRIVRDTVKTRKLKEIYEHRCQICDTRIEISTWKFLVEVHHIRPLGGVHRGLDDEANMIVVCPTHHACFDYGVAKFLSSKTIQIGKEKFELSMRYGHRLSTDSVKYHNEKIFGSYR